MPSHRNKRSGLGAESGVRANREGEGRVNRGRRRDTWTSN